MARVAPREKIVVGLMMEGGSWVSMVLVTGRAGLGCILGERCGKRRKVSRNGGICKLSGIQLGGRDVRWTPHF